MQRAHRRPRHAARMRTGVVLGVLGSLVLGAGTFGAVFGGTSLALLTGEFNTQDIGSIAGDAGEKPDYIAAPVNGDLTTATPVDTYAGEPVNILLIGSDVRSDENAALGGYVPGARGDTTIIVHISADRSRVDLVSIPRDARVRVADCESLDGKSQRGWTGKFNIAFANGFDFNNNPAEAAACVMRTINEMSGLAFDGQYVVADFAGFRDMIDALGGVPMCIPRDVYSKKAELDLEAGAQTLNGTQALAWARARTGSGLGDGTDLMRIERQQELIESVLRKALGMNVLTDIDVLTQFVRAAAGSFTMSEQLGDVSYVFGLAYSLRNLSMDNVSMSTIPWAYAGDGSGDVVITSAADGVWEALVADQPLPAKANDSSDDEEPDGGTGTVQQPVDASQLERTRYLPIPPEAAYVVTVERETEEQILASCVLED